MKMIEIIKYEAEDGTQFDEYIDCFKYELEKFHPEIYNIEFYDENNISSHITSKNIGDNDEIYNYCQKLIVHNDEEIEALRWISEYNGWCMFDVIDCPGIWEVTTVKNGERTTEIFMRGDNI